MATQKEIADHLNITTRQVQNLVASGVFHQAKGRNGLDLDNCRIAYINYVRIKPERQSAPVDDEKLDTETRREQLRLTRVRADAQELKNLQEKQKLLPVDLMRQSLARVSVQIASILDTLPSNIKRVQPALSNTAMDTIKAEVVKAQNLASESGGILEDLLNEVVDE